MSVYRNDLPVCGLLVLLVVLALALSGCSQPLGEAGPGGIEPIGPVAPEAPVPEAEEQPDPGVVLTAEAGAAQDPIIGVGIAQLSEADETRYTQSLIQGVQLAIEQINTANFLGNGRRLALMIGDTAIVDGEPIVEYAEPAFLEDVLATVGPVLRRDESDADVAVPLSLRPDAGTDVFGEATYVDNWVFRAGTANYAATQEIVAMARDQLGLGTVALLYNAAAAEASQVLIEDLTTEGIEVVASGSIDEDSFERAEDR